MSFFGANQRGSVARAAGKSNPDIVETCEIADFLVRPYWQQLAKKTTAEQEKFYQFAAEQANQLLTDKHSLTEHELNFLKLPINVKKRPRLTADRKEYDQYLEQVRKDGRDDYRAKYTQEFDKQASERFGLQEK